MKRKAKEWLRVRKKNVESLCTGSVQLVSGKSCRKMDLLSEANLINPPVASISASSTRSAPCLAASSFIYYIDTHCPVA